jgi:TetR/AcrR family transcriptional regulator, cholesterol catabolism regulator
MQVEKDNIRKVILVVARKEFLENGFKATSMRVIAQKSGVTLSNIYNYYKSKDKLFRAVLSRAIVAIDSLMNEHNKTEYVNLYIENAGEYVSCQLDSFVSLVIDNKEDLNLLFFKAAGSSFENFREQFINRHSNIGIEYIQKVKDKYPQAKIDISDFFIHTMSSWSISVIAELVSHKLTTNEIERFMSEYLAFGTAGWRKVMNIEG